MQKEIEINNKSILYIRKFYAYVFQPIRCVCFSSKIHFS